MRHSENRNLPIRFSLGPHKFQLQTMHCVVEYTQDRAVETTILLYDLF